MAISYDKVQDLSAAINLKFEEGLNQYIAVYQEITATIMSSGSSNIYPFGSVPAIEEWVGERNLGNIKEYKYILENKLYSSALKIPRTVLEDDEYGFYLKQANGLGQEAKQHPDTLLAQVIMDGFSTGKGYDGVPFFSANHVGASQEYSNIQKGTEEPWLLLDMSKPIPAFFYQERMKYTVENPVGLSDYTFMFDVYKYGVRGRCNVGYGLPQTAFGSQAELTKDSFEAAMMQMLQIKKDNGNNAGIMPTHIVVGPNNYAKALNLFEATLQTGSSNIWYQKVKPVLLCFLQKPVAPAGQQVKATKPKGKSDKSKPSNQEIPVENPDVAEEPAAENQ